MTITLTSSGDHSALRGAAPPGQRGRLDPHPSPIHLERFTCIRTACRGFDWFWDLGVWVVGSSPYGGHGLLIDVNDPDHLIQKPYSGAGGGYTRDYDKVWELGSQRWHHKGWDHWIVRNDQCKRAGNIVYVTANEIVSHLIGRAV